MIGVERKARVHEVPDAGAASAARQARHVVIVSLVAAVTALAVIIAMANTPGLRGVSLAYLVFIAGAVGGIASNYRRLQRLFAVQDPSATERTSQRLVTYQVYLSPVVGGLFALLLYGVFMSGTLFQGGLAPEFACAASPYVDLDGLAACAPTTHADVAKALVWAFAAGFIESLVPNFISTLTRNVGESNE